MSLFRKSCLILSALGILSSAFWIVSYMQAAMHWGATTVVPVPLGLVVLASIVLLILAIRKNNQSLTVTALIVAFIPVIALAIITHVNAAKYQQILTDRANWEKAHCTSKLDTYRPGLALYTCDNGTSFDR